MTPPPDIDPEQPWLNGSGPPECSSCTDLVRQPLHIWDVNGYYRDLRVPVDVTRKEMRLAYYALDGEKSPRLTYVLKQLLNPAIRRAYDLTPFGELFQDDYVLDMLRRKMQREMSKRFADMAEQGIDTSEMDPQQMQRDIYRAMGLEEVEPDEGEVSDTPGETVDSEVPDREDEPTRPAKFAYSYYLWKTRLRDEELGLSILAQWQQVLVTALSRQGVSKRFAVGLHGAGPHRWVQGQIGHRTVIFLNISEAPTDDLAQDLAKTIRREEDRSAALALLALTTKKR